MTNHARVVLGKGAQRSVITMDELLSIMVKLDKGYAPTTPIETLVFQWLYGIPQGMERDRFRETSSGTRYYVGRETSSTGVVRPIVEAPWGGDRLSEDLPAPTTGEGSYPAPLETKVLTGYTAPHKVKANVSNKKGARAALDKNGRPVRIDWQKWPNDLSRKVVYLREVQGLGFPQIARVVQRKVSATRAHYYSVKGRIIP